MVLPYSFLHKIILHLHKLRVPDDRVHWRYVGSWPVVEANAEVRAVKNVALHESVRIVEARDVDPVQSSDPIAAKDLKAIRSTWVLHLVCFAMVLSLP